MAEPLTGVLGADFSKFFEECTKANQALTTLVQSSDRMEAALNKVADATAGSEVSFTKLVSSYVSGQAILDILKESFSALAGFMTGTIDAAVESENAQSRLLAALQAQGTAMPSVVDAYDKYATQLQQTTVFSDDAAKAAETMLTMIGNVMPRDMKAALDASANLASGLKIDLSDAASMVSKALEGNSGALKKAGIQFDDTKGHVVSFGEIIDRINDKFGGQAAAAAETYEGRLKQLENAWSSLEGGIGRVITQNATVLKAVDLVTGSINKNTGELNANKTANDLVSSAVIGIAKAFDLELAAIDLLIAAYEKLTAGGNFLATSLLSVASTALDVLTGLREAFSYLNPEDYVNPEKYQKEVDALSGASDALRARIVELNKDQEASAASAEHWRGVIGSVREGLGGMIADLEATRGKTVEQKGAQDELSGAWDRGTTSVLGLKGAREAEAKAAAERLKAMKEEADWIEKRDKMEADSYAALEKLRADYVAAVGKGSADTAQAEIDNAWAAADAKIAAMQKSTIVTTEMYNLVYATAKQTADNIAALEMKGDNQTREYYVALADKAKAAYEFAAAHAENYTQRRLQQLRTESDAAQITLANWQEAADRAFNSTKNAADQATTAIRGVMETFDQAQQRFIDAANQHGGGSAGGVGLPGSHVETIGNQSWLVSPTGTRVPMGQQGTIPGAMTLPANWFEMYSGQSSFPQPFMGLAGEQNRAMNTTVNVMPGAVQQNYPVMNNPYAQQQLGRTVGDAVMSSLTRTGTLA